MFFKKSKINNYKALKKLMVTIFKVLRKKH